MTEGKFKQFKVPNSSLYYSSNIFLFVTFYFLFFQVVINVMNEDYSNLKLIIMILTGYLLIIVVFILIWRILYAYKIKHSDYHLIIERFDIVVEKAFGKDVYFKKRKIKHVEMIGSFSPTLHRAIQITYTVEHDLYDEKVRIYDVYDLSFDDLFRELFDYHKSFMKKDDIL